MQYAGEDELGWAREGRDFSRAAEALTRRASAPEVTVAETR
jgi:hypothetical protein